MRINKTTTLVETATTSNGLSQCHQSILLSMTNSNPPTQKTAPEEANPTSENTRPREIHDHNQMLLCVFSNNAGFFPVWPIIEFSTAT
jgi:hypothetical protein